MGGGGTHLPDASAQSQGDVPAGRIGSTTSSLAWSPPRDESRHLLWILRREKPRVEEDTLLERRARAPETETRPTATHTHTHTSLVGQSGQFLFRPSHGIDCHCHSDRDILSHPLTCLVAGDNFSEDVE
jgi:hypothetical protein